MKVGILGTGSWGTALGQVLCDNGCDVIMWGVDPAQVDDINQNHHNHVYFDDPIHEALHASADMTCVKDAWYLGRYGTGCQCTCCPYDPWSC